MTRYASLMRYGCHPLSLLAGLGLLLTACNGEPSAPNAATSGGAPADRASEVALSEPVFMTITVKGMHCEGCEGAICDKVGKIAGVTTVKASHAEERVEVQAPTELRPAIVAAITKLGYKIGE